MAIRPKVRQQSLDDRERIVFQSRYVTAFYDLYSPALGTHDQERIGRDVRVPTEAGSREGAVQQDRVFGVQEAGSYANRVEVGLQLLDPGFGCYGLASLQESSRRRESKATTTSLLG